MHHHILRSKAPAQAAVMAALAFVLLIGALGLALDGANAFGQRRRVGNAADAASLAATRQLIIEQRDGGDGTGINNTIAEFLTRNNIGGDFSWTAFYVSRADPDVQLAEVLDGVNVPSDADGVQVNILFTFDTYFMGVFGRRDLTVGASGTGIYGPLGTAVGQDLAPLALSVTGLQILQDEGTVEIDLRGIMATDGLWDIYPEDIPDDVITEANVKHVSFKDVAGAPETGNHCNSGSVVENLTYWWCNGSPNQLRINRELPSGSVSAWGTLKSAIDWRIDNRRLAVLPVYVDTIRFVNGVPETYYQLVNFVAVELESINGNYVLEITHQETYTTAGAMIGDGSGVETGVWAVNLTR